MKFSLKVFFSMTLVMMISFSAGGYWLIYSMFNAAVEREVQIAFDENRVLRYTLENALAEQDSSGSGGTDSAFWMTIKSTVDSVISQGTTVRVSDQEYRNIYVSSTSAVDGQILRELNANVRLYRLYTIDNVYYIQTACRIYEGEQMMYLESIRNISSIYADRRQNMQILRNITLTMIVGAGILVYTLSEALTRPIRRLSRAARRIAMGDLSVRANIKNHDEIGRLSDDFNTMAEQIQQKVHQLEDVNQRQEDFIASFAHELKTPLTSMIGYADMLRSKKMDPEDQFMAAGYIFSEGKRLESLSLKLLDMIVLDKKSYVRRPVNIPVLFDELDKFTGPSLGEHIQLVVRAEEGVIQADLDLLKTLLLNLIDNARKAIEEKGRIYLTGRKEKEGYAIYIRDTGKGIEKKDMPKITDPFYMADKSRSRQLGGAGLGLAICSKIVDIHQATMQFKSTPGKGTIVRLHFGEVKSDE